MKKLKIAVIGAGHMGKNHIYTWNKLAQKRVDIEFLGIADPAPKSQELASEYVCHWYADYKDLIEELKPDAVSIVVPTFLHKEVAVYCLKKGIHVLIEKPIALDMQESNEIISAAKSSNATVMVGHIEWFNPVVKKTKELLDRGKIGDPYRLIARRLKNKAVEGKTNVVLELGIHDIHLIYKLLKKDIKKIIASGKKIRFKEEEDSARVELLFDGASADIELSWACPYSERSLEIFGTKGCLKVNFINQTVEVATLNCEYKPEIIQADKIPPLGLELEEFLKTIKGETENPITPEEAALSLFVCLEANRQIKKKER